MMARTSWLWQAPHKGFCKRQTSSTQYSRTHSRKLRNNRFNCLEKSEPECIYDPRSRWQGFSMADHATFASAFISEQALCHGTDVYQGLMGCWHYCREMSCRCCSHCTAAAVIFLNFWRSQAAFLSFLHRLVTFPLQHVAPLTIHAHW